MQKDQMYTSLPLSLDEAFEMERALEARIRELRERKETVVKSRDKEFWVFLIEAIADCNSTLKKMRGATWNS
ncbi:hypothetical protein [Pseudoalteromonas luteoviolacea]|uniref:Uncharacterized protein n=1 Tax=Pseudoalteromonas luteoviolacea NCIMB 1942 TaxID=1365253 RepID=A0A162A8Y3_9GAMM|nr:hypothetical protein [Pseudoalteromonas luteoviolacea]KZN46013.1 hypothetical protein N482_13140 [Pseudoalteromonas luteoviolacea NCIMB 1942]